MSARRKVLVALAIAAVIAVPAAIAWACTPQATVSLDRNTYSPGDEVTVTGQRFEENADITLTLGSVGPVAGARANAVGYLRASFTLPAGTPAGSQTLTADGITSSGNHVYGLPKSVSFEVRPRDTAPAGSPRLGEDGRQGGTVQRPVKPGALPGRKPIRGAPGGGGGTRETEPRGRAPGEGGEVAPSGSGTVVGTVPTAGAGTVFGGSLPQGGRAAAPVDRVPLATAQDRSGAPLGASERAAAADLWSGFGLEDQPSLLPRATDTPVEGSGPGNQLTAGAALLGLGLAALLGGLAVGGARRRRSLARREQ